MAVVPETTYAVKDGRYLAYQVVGEGPRDIVLLAQARNPIDLMWDEPLMARGLRRLAGMGRLIAMDLRGWGASSQENLEALPAMQAWMDDVGIVLDAVGSERAVLFGSSETGLPAMLFAATHPDRSDALVVHAPYARYLRGPGHPHGMPEEVASRYVAAYREHTGTAGTLDFLAPSRVGDDAFRRWWARSERLGGAPSTVGRIYDMFMRTDLSGVLSAIRVPTLLTRRTGDRHVREGHARYVADRIAGARLVELPGDDHAWHAGDVDRVFDEIEAFLTGMRTVTTGDRTLATVLFTDIVDSTARAAALHDSSWSDVLSAHDDLAQSHVQAFGGRLVKSTGDGVLATFDGPARAIHCATGLRDSVETLGLQVRAGLHTGEIEQVGGDVRGIAVHLAARVAAVAGAGEVLVSRTVTDLVAGSGIAFEPRGTHTLKGVPGEWQLLAVTSA